MVTGRDSFLADDMVRGTVGFFRYLLHPIDLLSLRACLLTVLHCPAGAAQQLLADCREAGPTALLSGELPAPLGKAPELQKLSNLLRQYAPRAAKEKPLKLLTSWAESTGLTGHAAVNRAARRGSPPAGYFLFIEQPFTRQRGRCGAQRKPSLHSRCSHALHSTRSQGVGVPCSVPLRRFKGFDAAGCAGQARRYAGRTQAFLCRHDAS